MNRQEAGAGEHPAAKIRNVERLISEMSNQSPVLWFTAETVFEAGSLREGLMGLGRRGAHTPGCEQGDYGTANERKRPDCVGQQCAG